MALTGVFGPGGGELGPGPEGGVVRRKSCFPENGSVFIHPRRTGRTDAGEPSNVARGKEQGVLV